jgi:peptide/nickel transport system permease protein
MNRYILTRLWQSAITLILASLVVFIGVRQLPGRPGARHGG